MIVYLVPTYTACCNTLHILTIVIGFVDDAYGGCLDTKTQTNYQFKAPTLVGIIASSLVTSCFTVCLFNHVFFGIAILNCTTKGIF